MLPLSHDDKKITKEVLYIKVYIKIINKAIVNILIINSHDLLQFFFLTNKKKPRLFIS